jgi:hypothetical protein
LHHEKIRKNSERKITKSTLNNIHFGKTPDHLKAAAHCHCGSECRKDNIFVIHCLNIALTPLSSDKKSPMPNGCGSYLP